jgi:hypothetical protein
MFYGSIGVEGGKIYGSLLVRVELVGGRRKKLRAEGEKEEKKSNT